MDTVLEFSLNMTFKVSRDIIQVRRENYKLPWLQTSACIRIPIIMKIGQFWTNLFEKK